MQCKAGQKRTSRVTALPARVTISGPMQNLRTCPCASEQLQWQQLGSQPTTRCCARSARHGASGCDGSDDVGRGRAGAGASGALWLPRRRLARGQRAGGDDRARPGVHRGRAASTVQRATRCGACGAGAHDLEGQQLDEEAAGGPRQGSAATRARDAQPGDTLPRPAAGPRGVGAVWSGSGSGSGGDDDHRAARSDRHGLEGPPAAAAVSHGGAARRVALGGSGARCRGGDSGGHGAADQGEGGARRAGRRGRLQPQAQLARREPAAARLRLRLPLRHPPGHRRLRARRVADARRKGGGEGAPEAATEPAREPAAKPAREPAATRGAADERACAELEPCSRRSAPAP